MVSAKMFTKKLSKVSEGAELSISDVHADAGVDLAADGSFEDAQDVRSRILPLHHQGCMMKSLFQCQDLLQPQHHPDCQSSDRLRHLQTLLHPAACKEEGGFGFHDRELMETQRAAILELAKDVRSASGLTMATLT